MCVQEEDTTRTAQNTLGCETNALWITWRGGGLQGAGTRPSPDARSEVWTLASSFVPPRTGAAQWRAAVQAPLCRPGSRTLSKVKKGDGQGSLVSNSCQMSSAISTILSYFLFLKSFQKKEKWNFLVSLILILNFSSVCLLALCSGKFCDLFLTFGEHVFISVTSLLISVRI